MLKQLGVISMLAFLTMQAQAKVNFKRLVRANHWLAQQMNHHPINHAFSDRLTALLSDSDRFYLRRVLSQKYPFGAHVQFEADFNYLLVKNNGSVVATLTIANDNPLILTINDSKRIKINPNNIVGSIKTQYQQANRTSPSPFAQAFQLFSLRPAYAHTLHVSTGVYLSKAAALYASGYYVLKHKPDSFVDTFAGGSFNKKTRVSWSDMLPNFITHNDDYRTITCGSHVISGYTTIGKHTYKFHYPLKGNITYSRNGKSWQAIISSAPRNGQTWEQSLKQADYHTLVELVKESPHGKKFDCLFLFDDPGITENQLRNTCHINGKNLWYQRFTEKYKLDHYDSKCIEIWKYVWGDCAHKVAPMLRYYLQEELKSWNPKLNVLTARECDLNAKGKVDPAHCQTPSGLQPGAVKKQNYASQISGIEAQIKDFQKQFADEHHLPQELKLKKEASGYYLSPTPPVGSISGRELGKYKEKLVSLQKALQAKQTEEVEASHGDIKNRIDLQSLMVMRTYQIRGLSACCNDNNCKASMYTYGELNLRPTQRSRSQQ